MGKDCIERLNAKLPEVHEYMQKKIGNIDVESEAGRAAYLKAARDLQDHSLSQIHSIYHQVGAKGYEKPTPTLPPDVQATEKKTSETAASADGQTTEISPDESVIKAAKERSKGKLGGFKTNLPPKEPDVQVSDTRMPLNEPDAGKQEKQNENVGNKQEGDTKNKSGDLPKDEEEQSSKSSDKTSPIAEEKRKITNIGERIKDGSRTETKTSSTETGVQGLATNKTEVLQPKLQELQKLRGAGDKNVGDVETELQSISNRYGGKTDPEAFSGEDRQRWRLLQRELQVGDVSRANKESKDNAKGVVQGDANATSSSGGRDGSKILQDYGQGETVRNNSGGGDNANKLPRGEEEKAQSAGGAPSLSNKKENATDKPVEKPKSSKDLFKDTHGVTYDEVNAAVEKIKSEQYKVNNPLEKALRELGLAEGNYVTERTPAYSDYVKIKLEDELPKKLPTNKEKINVNYADGFAGTVDVKPIEQKTKSAEKSTKGRQASLGKYVSKDDLRPAMMGVFHDAENKALVITDAQKMVWIDDTSIKETKVVDPKTGKTIDARFPDYKAVIPQDNPIKVNGLSAQDLINQTAGLDRANKFISGKEILSVIKVGDNTFPFDPKLLNEVVTMMAENGAKTISVELSKPTRAMVLSTPENKNVHGLLMPRMFEEGAIPYKVIFERELTAQEVKDGIAAEIRGIEKDLKYHEDGVKKDRKESFPSSYHSDKVKELKRQLAEKREDLSNLNNPLEEQDNLQTVKENIDNGNITEEQAIEHLSKTNEQLSQSESVVKDIESKAESEDKADLDEVIQKADGLISGKPQSKLLDLADKIEKDGILPDFMKAKLPDGTELQGLDISKAVSDAIRFVDKAIKAGTEIAKAIEDGFQKLKEAYDKNGWKFNKGDEAAAKRDFAKYVTDNHENSQVIKDYVDLGIKDYKTIEKSVLEDLGEDSPEIRKKLKDAFDYYQKHLAEEAPKAEVPPKKETPPPVEPPKEETVTPDALDPEMTKMANAIVDAEVEGKFGVAALDKILSKLQDTNLKAIYEKVKESIRKGAINVKDVRERLITTKQGSEEDQAVLMYDLAELKGKESDLTKSINDAVAGSPEQVDLQKKLMDVQNEMMDNALANRVLGRTGSTIFRLRQLWVNKEKTIVDMEEEYKAAKGLKDLTPEQQKEIKNVYDQMRELRAKRDAAKESLDKAVEENARLKEENEKLKQLKDKSVDKKKADRKTKNDEIIKKSNERIKKSKDNLRGLRGNMNAGFDPRVAVEVGKIAAEKFYQGVVKFDQLVKNVLDEVSDVFPDWTEDDVVNHILTTTDKHGKTVPTLTSDKYIASKKLLSRSDKNLQEKVKAYEQAQKEVALNQFQWQKDRRMDMMKTRPVSERIIDGLLRWQRFAVLSYPSTMVKLLAVVGHQLTLKPLKFLIQKGIASPISGALGIKGKQNIWGDPKWSSLAKYYSTFIRNFALTNLKEQFSGIDTKEMLYGRPMMFDEWNAAKGLLEMPGRSHGYIKSFIKNPEFQFAHEQHISYNLGKMAEIQKQLDDPYLTKDQETDLRKEFDKYDVTNEDVMERVNKLSLEHSKWSILMNDNKFVDKFRQWTKGNDIASALIKSELPIVKIPINYVGRAFATKYGLIKALTGSKWYKGNTPSILEIMYKGSENVTEEQANLLGKTLTIGSMGAAFFMLGYWNRKEVEVNEDGSITVHGVHMSKNLIHSPELESFFSGSETGNKYDKQKVADDKLVRYGYKPTNASWIKDFAQSDADIAKKNPFANLLTYGFLPNVAKTLLSDKKSDKGHQIQDAVARKVGDMLIPGFVKQPAGWLDTGEEGVHPMNDVIKRGPYKQTEGLERFWQIIEKDIPGLRKNVPQSNNQSR